MSDVIYGTGQSYVGGTSGSDTIVATTGGSQLDGGAGNDNINGSSGNDIITGGKGNDFMYGGAGNDTFLFHASDLGSDGLTYDKIFDFEGAGVASGDRLTFYGFGVGSTFTVAGTQAISGGAVIYKYLLTDSTTGNHEYVYVTSKTGLALTTDDYAFFGSVGSPT